MTQHIAFVTDSLDKLTLHSDTTLLIQTAQDRGYQVFWMRPSDIHIKHQTPVGHMAAIRVTANEAQPFECGESFLAPIERLDVVWWRQTPPYAVELHFALDALQLISEKTKLVNAPQALRNINEHLFSLRFPRLIPQSLCTKSAEAVRAFVQDAGGKALVRPLYASPGESFLLRTGDPNLSLLSEGLTQRGHTYVLCQRWQGNDPSGDKRLFIVNGELFGSVLQVPAVGELRGSFERGAEASATEASDADRQIVQQLGPALRDEGIFYATIDVIGGQIAELNFSNPVGLQQLQHVNGGDVFAQLFDALG